MSENTNVTEVTDMNNQNTTNDPVASGVAANRPADKTGNGESMPTLDTKNGPSSKAEVIKYLGNLVVGMSFEEMTAFFNSLKAAQTSKDATYGGSNTTANAATIKTHKEDLDALLAGADLSEEFQTKAATIFEAVLEAKMVLVQAELEEANEVKLAEAVEATKAELATKVNDFITAIAEKYQEDNKLAIKAALQVEAVESFMKGLKGLFAEHYVSIPEDKVDVVEALSTEVEEIEAKLNASLAESVELRKKLREIEAKAVLESTLEGLTDTQKDRVRALAEAVEVTTVAEYTAKIVTLKEAVAKPEVKTLNEDALADAVPAAEAEKRTASVDPVMAAYVQAARRTVAK